MRSLRPNARSSAAAAVVLIAGVLGAGSASAGTHAAASASARTATPIKHVIVIVGENHTFDNVFATYKPRHGQSVKNLLSEGIVRANGSPGPHVSLARQWTAKDVTADGYSTDPKLVAPYKTLPAPNTTYVDPRCDGGQAMNADDSRFPANLPNAPFQITKYVPYDEVHADFQVCDNGAYVGDPLHRFYQMNQQTEQNQNKLWVWTADTAGDSNGAAPTGTTDQGAVSMGFYNVQHGDAPVLDYLANHFSMSDNYHQAVMGGTGTNHVALGTGSAASYENADRRSAHAAGQPDRESQSHSRGRTTSTPRMATRAARTRSAPIRRSRESGLWSATSSRCGRTPPSGCAPNTYYMLNNYNPGYLANGTPDPDPFAVPPQSQTTFPTIGDELNAHSISWGYYGQDWNNGNPTSSSTATSATRSSTPPRS